MHGVNVGVTMKDRKGWRALVHMEMIECHSAFLLGSCVLCGMPSRDLVVYHLERGVMLLHGVVSVNCKKTQLLNINMQVPGIWAKECMLDKRVCII